MSYDQKLWQKCIDFHGHSCPGLAIGFQCAQLASKLLQKEYASDEELICIAENDACGLDAIQVILKTTIGKGNLLLYLSGKHAYSFYNRNNQEKFRLLLKDYPPLNSRDAKLEYLLTTKAEDLFKVGATFLPPPEKAVIFNAYPCSKCGEKTAENKLRLQNNEKYCLSCYNEYQRFWLP